ncbi:uncharacterized protein K489DRAFT_381658 [Dissoconium aciculare CBS 342.82]|uniref:Uncharacterized protein n=1 Tax=Dissoconium aciculare CBS 342.82 TaxID=1314786 RepID=A0A6J3M427_9PEZI|nr:uncharacterized protein K489DRAFT_381658 [Dissoconium aciculare CBS 342.82]KAF1821672.1 hypothetical protein K489DRAFT_381658 [Dissoconium aciculare CBS 342.82]
MQSIRNAIKRKLSLHDKNPPFDTAQDEDDVDDETRGHLEKETERAETEGHPHGKPGSFLNKLIMHGNKKTEDEIARDAEAREAARRRAATGDGVLVETGAGTAGKENVQP